MMLTNEQLRTLAENAKACNGVFAISGEQAELLITRSEILEKIIASKSTDKGTLYAMKSWREAPCNGVDWAKGYQAGWNKYHDTLKGSENA